ncbi:MAG TPA: hypothetical protein VLX91_07270 [Candidatus Acidoferrales bacterium]|nr:hypothetical protein [Candidatus Acidoferrales bacterium]
MSNIKFLTAKLFSLFAVFAISGCAVTKAPSGYLPDDTETQWEVYGGWITLDLSTKAKDSTVAGEFIAFQDSSVYVLTETKPVVVPCGKISHAALEFHSNKSGIVGGWTALGTLSTISHGFFFILTAPLWLLTGIPATISESYSGKFNQTKPDLDWWSENKKYSRFPQGIPRGLDLYRLKLKKLEL